MYSLSRQFGKTRGGSDRIIENGVSGLRKAASFAPCLKQIREGMSKHVHHTGCDGLNHRDVVGWVGNKEEPEMKAKREAV